MHQEKWRIAGAPGAVPLLAAPHGPAQVPQRRVRRQEPEHPGGQEHLQRRHAQAHRGKLQQPPGACGGQQQTGES